jgi:CheY-like chemotaxis protein
LRGARELLPFVARERRVVGTVRAGAMIYIKPEVAERQYAHLISNGPAALSSLSKLPTISIVDDDASVRASMSNFLRSLGYVVHTFGSAEEFLGSAGLNDTSCVISDVQMSPTNGFELLAIMRLRGHAVPFIFITAFPDESVRARALMAGAVGFLAKPFAMPNLIACLHSALPSQGGDVGA